MQFLWVVNATRPLGPMFIPRNLIWDPAMKVWLTKETYEAFYLLTRKMQADGIAAPEVDDGYRSYAYQKKLYENELAKVHYKRYASKLVIPQKRIQPPGTSEHQLGTAIDLTFTSQEEQQQWLERYAASYGLILRYPQAKEYVTGRVYDPRHYRYVGIGHAKKITKMNMCLEEYITFYLQKNYKNRYLGGNDESIWT